MSEESEVIYLAGLAKMLGKTEASIREGIRRGAEWLPKGTKIAGKHAWLREDVRKFLREYVDGQQQKAKSGRKRREAPKLVRGAATSDQDLKHPLDSLCESLEIAHALGLQALFTKQGMTVSKIGDPEVLAFEPCAIPAHDAFVRAIARAAREIRGTG